MDERMVDRLSRLMGARVSRKDLGRVVAGGALSLGLAHLALADADAKQHGKHRKKRQRRANDGAPSVLPPPPPVPSDPGPSDPGPVSLPDRNLRPRGPLRTGLRQWVPGWGLLHDDRGCPVLCPGCRLLRGHSYRVPES